MKRDDKAKCECGGETKYYDGAVGYEAMVCRVCGFHWNGQTQANHLRQVEEYRLIKRAVTRDLVRSLEQFIECWPQFETDEAINGSELVEFCTGWYRDAKAAIAKAKGEA